MINRSDLCESFLKREGLNCVSIIGENDEGHFTWSGCDTGCTTKGVNVYDCNGFHPSTKKVIDGYRICGECLDYFYNGTDSEVNE